VIKQWSAILCNSIISLFLLPAVSGQNAPDAGKIPAVVIEKFDDYLNFDGIPDEECWQKILPLEMKMHSPVFGKEPTEKTEVRLGYDDRYLYLGVYFHYNESGKMSSVSLKRDFMGMGGDWLGLILDTYNDKENALAFFTTPDGLRFDASIQRDAVVAMPDQFPMNVSWNTFWDVETKKNDKGWSAELRITFSSLRFQEVNGEVRMGLIVERWIPAWNETVLFPAIPPNWGAVSFMKPSQAQEIVLQGVNRQNRFIWLHTCLPDTRVLMISTIRNRLCKR